MIIDRVTTRSGQPLPRSLYAAGVQPLDRQPLDGDARHDIAIVGAGFTGLSTALDLAARGVDCVVLEANEPGWGASGRNGGQINPGLKSPPDTVERDLGAAAVTFSQSAPDRVFELVARHGIDCGIHRGGTLRAATDAKGAADFASMAKDYARRGIPARVLDRAEMREITGADRYAGGFLDPAGGQLDPLAYARGLAKAVRAAGIPIHCDTPVLRADHGPGGWRLATPRGTVTADKVLFATNGYSDGLVPRLARSMLPVYSSIVASHPLPQDLAARITAGRPSVFEVGPVTTYYRIDARNRLIFGGRGRMGDASGPEPFGGLRRYAERLWPDLAGHGWQAGWNGRVALTADHYPHLHVLNGSAIACVGYNGRGVAMASAMGTELGRWLAEGRLEVFRSTGIRTIAFQPLWPAGLRPALWMALLRAKLG